MCGDFKLHTFDSLFADLWPKTSYLPESIARDLCDIFQRLRWFSMTTYIVDMFHALRCYFKGFLAKTLISEKFSCIEAVLYNRPISIIFGGNTDLLIRMFNTKFYAARRSFVRFLITNRSNWFWPFLLKKFGWYILKPEGWVCAKKKKKQLSSLFWSSEKSFGGSISSLLLFIYLMIIEGIKRCKNARKILKIKDSNGG